MTTIAYPSREFQGLPSVIVEVPVGREVDCVQGSTLAARLPREGEFAPNIVDTVDTVDTVEQCPTPGSEERA